MRGGFDMKYKSFSLRNFREIPQISKLKKDERFAIEVVGNVLPFKTNNYFVDELIDWDAPLDDPLFRLNFPQKEMIAPDDFMRIAGLIGVGKTTLTKILAKKFDAKSIFEDYDNNPYLPWNFAFERNFWCSRRNVVFICIR